MHTSRSLRGAQEAGTRSQPHTLTALGDGCGSGWASGGEQVEERAGSEDFKEDEVWIKGK